MSYPQPRRQPLDNDLHGRLAQRLRDARTDDDLTELEVLFRDVAFAFGYPDPDRFIRSLVELADDRWGIDSEQWRVAASYKMHASDTPPRSPAEIKRVRRRLTRQGYVV